MLFDKNSRCIPVSGCSNSTYCINTLSKVFHCPSGLYLDPTKFTCTNFSTATTEPNGSIYQTFSCAYRGFSNCPSPGYTNNYSFTCPNNYRKLFYSCLANTDYSSTNSGLYFSSLFSFLPMYMTINVIPGTSTPLNEYYVETWIYIDFNVYANNPGNPYINSSYKYYYLFPHPHTIFAKYNNGILSFFYG